MYRLDVLPQFTVSGNTTVHVADSKLTVVTLRPAVVRNVSVELRHPLPVGPMATVEWETSSAIYISPTTRRPTVGTLQEYPSAQLAGRAKGIPHQYNLAFASTSALIPPQRHVISPASLATVQASYFSDVTGIGGQQRYGRFPVQFHNFLVRPPSPGFPSRPGKPCT